MFTVEAVAAKLVNMTPYSEKHGDESVSGLALKLSMVLPRSILNTLHPALQGTVFVLDDEDLPLAFPEIESIAWNRQVIGGTVRIGYDDFFESAPIVLSGAEVGKIVLAPQLGGSVDVTLRVKCKPDATAVGQLYEWLQKSVMLTIEPPLAGVNIDVEPDDADEHSGALVLDGVR